MSGSVSLLSVCLLSGVILMCSSSHAAQKQLERASSTTSSASITNAPSLGTVTNDTAIICPSGFAAGMNCRSVSVSCSGTATIKATYGVITPANKKGTIVLIKGGGGTVTYDLGFPDLYYNAGYEVVQYAWASEWPSVGKGYSANILAAACRPATLLSYIYSNVHGGAAAGSAMCAHGGSGGADALAYALAWYNAGSYLDKVLMASGPDMNAIAVGCKVPAAPSVEVCPPGQMGCVGPSWMNSVQYTGTSATALQNWTGDSSCAGRRNTTLSSQQNWINMSVDNGQAGSSFSYPQTALSAWLCSNGNQQAGLAQYYFSKFTNINQFANDGITPFYSVNRVDNCTNMESVHDGTTSAGVYGQTAMYLDMVDPVAGCVLRH
jgi:hypothetical protein